MITIAAIIGFTIGNFIYQFFTKRNWGIALERSFFQIIAILGHAFLFKS